MTLLSTAQDEAPRAEALHGPVPELVEGAEAGRLGVAVALGQVGRVFGLALLHFPAREGGLNRVNAGCI